MGCDIHLHTEVKIKGKWHHYSHPNVNRNYRLFARMAGVRNEGNNIQPIAEPRGIPDDATELTNFDYEHWLLDLHSPSWLNAKEISELEYWAHKNCCHPESAWRFASEFCGYLFGNTYSGFTEVPDHHPYTMLEDIRFIFWFDN